MTINPVSPHRFVVQAPTIDSVAQPKATPHNQPVHESTPNRVPEGANPQLWSTLTPEEQSFFLKQSSLGPLTYGPKSETRTMAEAPRGQRVDVRV